MLFSAAARLSGLWITGKQLTTVNCSAAESNNIACDLPLTVSPKVLQKIADKHPGGLRGAFL